MPKLRHNTKLKKRIILRWKQIILSYENNTKLKK